MLSTAFSRFVNIFRKKQHQQQNQQQPKTEMETITTTPSATTSSSNYCKIDEIRNYLLVNCEFLEEFVMNEIDVETVEKWLIRKTQRLRRISDRSLMAVVAEEISEETEAIVSAAKTIACASGYAASESVGSGAITTGSKSPRKTSLSRWKFCVHADKRKMLQEMTQSLQIKPAKDHVLWELANCISSAINADGFCLYIVDEYTKSLISLRVYDADEDQRTNGQQTGRQFRLRRTANSSKNGPEPTKSTNGVSFITDFGMKISLAEHVADTKKAMRMKRSKLQEFFDVSQYENLDEMAHILCQPIVQPDNQLAAVLEMWRKDSNSAFHEEDDEIVCSYLVWGGIALHYAHLFVNLNKQKKLNDFLLVVVKSIFHDMISIDSLVTKIMNFAQKLVDADRASLFLLDAKTRELYATIFDVGNKNGNEEMSESNGGVNCEREQPELETEKSTSTDTNKKMFSPENGEIRFPIGTGIAGIVALTGKILNISDAYSDSRFNRTIDQLTGYKTETILCMPIYTRNTIIGVVQMINKRFGSFTKEDELAFETFAVYCGLALHHAKLYDKIRRSEQKYKVALDVLTYHNTCTDTEYEQISQNPEQLSTEFNFTACNDYDLNPFAIDDTDKVRFALYMFDDLFGFAKFDRSRLIRFVLTVKKNYRRVPYHNWTHGFAVAHCMYTILKRANGYFRPNECLALFIASLCHDLDHRGKNNKFMLDTESPLAAVYSTSTMEHHHFNQTVIILQQEQNNIFNKFTNSEYKQILSLLKHCIIATDLVVFFQNKSRISDIVAKKKFNWSTREHRQLILAIAMTACDLCASAKSWPIQKDTVQLIFEEFYQQGDEEKRFGLEPIAMMDRTKIDYQPASQVSFLTNICIPCYTLLSDLVPETKPLLDACNQNLNKWREIDKCNNSAHSRDLT